MNEPNQYGCQIDFFANSFEICVFQSPAFFKGLLPLGKDKVVLGELF